MMLDDPPLGPGVGPFAVLALAAADGRGLPVTGD